MDGELARFGSGENSPTATYPRHQAVKRAVEKAPEIRRNQMLKHFLQDEQGQDLIEYTLLVAFVCLATAALFVNSGGSLSGIWISANSQLGAANTSAS
jgi:Flp pilus assembly pilin Flp